MVLTFQVRSRWIDGQTCVVEPHGDIDLATVPHLDRALTHAVARTPATLILDLTNVDFIDSRGVGVIQAAHEQLRATGGDLLIVCRAAHLRRVLDLASDNDITLDVVEAYPHASKKEGLPRLLQWSSAGQPVPSPANASWRSL